MAACWLNLKETASKEKFNVRMELKVRNISSQRAPVASYS
jgi:hypothetical protein